MPRKAKEKDTLKTAGARKDTESIEGVKSMTVKDKIRIVAMHINHKGKKEIAGVTGFPMDWIKLVLDTFGADSQFVNAAVKLNAGSDSAVEAAITEGLGGAKRG